MSDLNIINVVVDKTDKTGNYDVFEMAWKVLIQRFENTLSHRNFSGPGILTTAGCSFQTERMTRS